MGPIWQTDRLWFKPSVGLRARKASSLCASWRTQTDSFYVRNCSPENSAARPIEEKQLLLPHRPTWTLLDKRLLNKKQHRKLEYSRSWNRGDPPIEPFGGSGPLSITTLLKRKCKSPSQTQLRKEKNTHKHVLRTRPTVYDPRVFLPRHLRKSG